jgi:hypothetical protein
MKAISPFRILVLPLLLLASSAHAESTPTEVFEQLKSLVGTWEGKRTNGSTVQVVYKLTAADTVLVETWTMSPTRESMTLYHMDDKALIATHYCPIGNQPTLQLKRVAGRLFNFEFRSATNLPDRKVEHEHLFEIELLAKDKYRRKETYVENGAANASDMVFTRTR